MAVREGTDVGALLDDARTVSTAPVLPVSTVVVGGAALLVRLHGASSTVDADQRTIEAHLGETFRVADADEASALLARSRDGAFLSDTVVEASVRPSRLAELWALVRDQAPREVVMDAYAGKLRAGFDELGVDRLRDLTRGVEALGGAVSVPRGANPSLGEIASRPSEAEALLVEGLRRAFDPQGLLWPARG